MVTDISNTESTPWPTPRLPDWAALPINRCNLPPQILGGLRFQQHPKDLMIDGIKDLHGDLYRHLASLKDNQARAERFMDYMTVHFTLSHLDEAGASAASKRQKADYLKLLRGWFFDTESREAAVLKGWVESRFGLVTRYHGQKFKSAEDKAYTNYQWERGFGLLGTNALEAQLDLLYAYAQEEWQNRREDLSHLTLYRGINRLEDFDLLDRPDRKRAIMVLNNLNSFSKDPERASEFGDIVLRAAVPRQKVVFHEGLLPGRLQGEAEYLVLGGAYRVYLSA